LDKAFEKEKEEGWMTMDDLISRKAAIESCLEIARQEHDEKDPLAIAWAHGVRYAAHVILPTVDAAPVKHGRWINSGYACGENKYVCSVCGENEWRTDCRRMKYCMFCGAKMDLEG
jgi:hypothetical protein